MSLVDTFLESLLEWPNWQPSDLRRYLSTNSTIYLENIRDKMGAMIGEVSVDILHGRLVGVTGKAPTAEVVVWLAVQTTDGEASTLETITDDEGFFSFEPPTEPLRAAKLGAVLEGVQPLDLEPNDEPLEPGEIMLFVDDFAPSHLKYAG